VIFKRKCCPSSSPQAGGLPLIGHPLLFIQHLYSRRNNRKVKKAACPKDEMARQCGKYVGKHEGK